MNSSTNEVKFSKLRAALFPIHGFELKKVLPMGLIFFFILLNYSCLRSVKDALVVPAAGAEAIPFLKSYFVVPCAMLFMIFYISASNRMSNERLFYMTITPFLIFFGAFAFFIYPNKELVHPSMETIANLKAAYPRLTALIAVWEYWTYSVFYILAEIWGSAILSLSFWQFANQICKTAEAKRFYTFFSFVGQLSLLAYGGFGGVFSQVKEGVVDPWAWSLKLLMGMVVVSGILTMVLYRWIYKYVLTDKRFYDKPNLPGVVKSDDSGKKKKKPGLGESFKTILTSPYLGLIAMLVVCYGTSVNLVEGLWKWQLKKAYATPNEYSQFMSQYQFWTGVATMVMLVVGSNFLRKFSWKTCAMLTPLVMLVGGAFFLAFILMGGQMGDVVAKVGTSPVMMAVIMGTLITIGAKATKYALFDLTKEMAYIPLDEQMKVQGKAAVDVVGGRLGKSGGALTQSTLLLVFTGGYSSIAPYLAGVFLVMCFVWLWAVKRLSVRVEAARAASGESK